MLSVYKLEQDEEWDAVVRSFMDYDIYWLSGYVKAFQIHGDGEPLLFYYEDEDTRGVNVVMRRDVADSPYFKEKLPKEAYLDFATPYGYGGWLTEGENSRKLFEEYEKWCRKNGIISEFVRFHPVVKNHCFAEDFYNLILLGKTVVMDLSSKETIWTNITSKNRNMIRKAEKNGIKIYNGHYPEIYGIFRTIYDGTMKKDHANEYYYFEDRFYESVLVDLPENAQVFYAELEGQIIAASIMLLANGKMNYHLSGSVEKFSHLAPGNLLLYKAALWGCENGYKTLHLGGGLGCAEDNLFKFKKAFCRTGNYTSFYIGEKIFDTEKYEELVSRREESCCSYFPRYRA